MGQREAGVGGAGHNNIIGNPLIGKRRGANDADTESYIDALRNDLADGLVRNNGRDDVGIITENLNPVVVNDANKVPAAVHRDTLGPTGSELAVAVAITAPLSQIVAVAIELINAVIGRIEHIDIVAAVHRNGLEPLGLDDVVAVWRTAPLRQIASPIQRATEATNS